MHSKISGSPIDNKLISYIRIKPYEIWNFAPKLLIYQLEIIDIIKQSVFAIKIYFSEKVHICKYSKISYHQISYNQFSCHFFHPLNCFVKISRLRVMSTYQGGSNKPKIVKIRLLVIEKILDKMIKNILTKNYAKFRNIVSS